LQGKAKKRGKEGIGKRLRKRTRDGKPNPNKRAGKEETEKRLGVWVPFGDNFCSRKGREKEDDEKGSGDRTRATERFGREIKRVRARKIYCGTWRTD